MYHVYPLSLSVLSQILIELETALLDDIPHWYKLQTHDVSSIPLPQPSPYLPRRHVHGDSPSKKLQSMSVYTQYMYINSMYIYLFVLWTYSRSECVVANFSFTELSIFRLSVRETDTQNLSTLSSPVCVCVVFTCVRVQGLIASLIQSLMMVWW